MKIAFVVPDPTLGPNVSFGDSMRIRLLDSALRELGHEVELLWGGPAGDPGGPVPPRRLPPLPRSARPLLRDLRTLAGARRQQARLPALDPDLVLEFAAYLAPVGLRVARRRRVPYVVEVEGPLSSLRYERGRSPLRRLGDRWLAAQLRAAGAVLTVSAPLAEQLVGLGAARDAVVVAPNVADPAVFRRDDGVRAQARAELGLDTGTFVIGFHGVFSPWYALPRLVEAAALMTTRDVCILLVGDGVERDAVEDAADRLGIRVIITGFVDQERAAALIQAADVGAVPDHAWWTSPLKLFELGAVEKPVVAARVASVLSVAGEDELALVDPASLHELAAAFDRLAGDPSLRASLARAWHARVRREYLLPSLVANVAKAIELAVR